MQLDPSNFATSSVVAAAVPTCSTTNANMTNSALNTPSQSPAKNPCKVRVRAGNYRNEPYGARVLPPLNNAPKIPAAEPQQQYDSTIEPTARPRPNNRRITSMFASRMYDNVARAADFTSPVNQPQASEVHQQQDTTAMPQPPAFGNPHNLRRTPPAEPSHEVEVAHQHIPHSSNQTQIADNTPVADAEPMLYAFVRFKYESCCFKSSFNLTEGARVVVEGDRGINMGMVERVIREKPTYPVPCSISRFASDEEMRVAAEFRLRELEATQLATEFSMYYRLPIRIIDTEFQFDGQKLTIFYDANGFVDFRRLQRAMFREYNCRIWLVNWKEIRRNIQ